MGYSEIDVSLENNVAIIEINRPKRMNALSLSLLDEIESFLTDGENQREIRCLIITGKDQIFSVGADLSSPPESYEDALDFFKKVSDFFYFFENLPISTIASINGLALGGGLELSLCCDLRIASDTAALGLPEIDLGIMPGGGGTQRLPRVAGLGNAKELLLLGEPVAAKEAYRMNLVNRVFTRDELRDKTMEMAIILAGKPPLSVRAIKEAANAALNTELYRGISLETHLASGLATTEYFKETVKKFFKT